ncbi:MAG: efflux RND transporter periplasmic adaptor subunit [Rhodomicrobium sp.]
MKRLTPYLIFILITGGLVAFIYKDRIFPPAETAATGARGDARQGGAGGHHRGEQVIPVLAGKAKTDNVPVYLNGVGTVQAYNTAIVRTQVSGRLIDVPYTEGQYVKEGDILAKVDPALYQAAYDQAVAQKAKDEAVLANARLDEKRYSNLVKTNAATQQQADTATWTVHQDEAAVKLDQAAIDNAWANLQWTTIKAPFAGKTGIRLVDKGNLVSSADATGIVIIAQLQPITVVFTLPEDTVADVLDASAKGPVELQALSGGKVTGDGTLLVVDNQIDQSTGTYKIKGTFANQQNRLWPGLFVNVRLKLKILPNVIVVPSVAVQQGANGSYVYIVTPESTVKLAYVKVIQEGEQQSVIGSGISEGDLVVTTGFASLQDGAKVKADASASDKGAPAAAAPAAPTGASKGTNGDYPHRRGQNKQAGGAGADNPATETAAEVKQADEGSRKP